MTLPKQKHYELVYLLLYAIEMGNDDPEKLIELLSLELKIAKRHLREAMEQASEIHDKIPGIDSRLSRISTQFEFSRIQSVERCILRLSAFNMLISKSLPDKVIISEALRLSKKFATPASVRFVNALLDHLYKEKLGEPSSTKEIEESYSALLESERANTNYDHHHST